MFKVGDMVTINPRLALMDRHEEPIIIDEMLRFAGAKATIKCVGDNYNNRYRLEAIPWWWHEKWLILDNTNEFDVHENELTELIGD